MSHSLSYILCSVSFWSWPSWILYFVIFWRPLFWTLVSTGLNKRPSKWYNSIVNDRKLWALQKKNIGMQKRNMKMSFVAAVNLLSSSIFCLSLPLYFFKLSRACLCSSSFVFRSSSSVFRSSSLLVMNFMRDSHVVSSSVTLFEMLLWVKVLQIEPLNPFKRSRHLVFKPVCTHAVGLKYYCSVWIDPGSLTPCSWVVKGTVLDLNTSHSVKR